MERKKSLIKVAVLDMTEVEELAIQFRAIQLPKTQIVGVHTEKWGIVTTQRGIFALTSEGVGPKSPITNDNFLTISFWGEYKNDDGVSVDCTPFSTLNINLDSLKEFGIEKEIPLHEFIRNFGGRLENNYDMWKTMLENQ